MNNDKVIQPLLQIMMEEYCRYYHGLNESIKRRNMYFSGNKNTGKEHVFPIIRAKPFHFILLLLS